MNRNIAESASGKLVGLLVPVSYVFASVLFVYAAVMTAIGKYWISQFGDLSSVGLASICALFILGGSRFREAGLSPGKSIVLALLFGNAFLQSYEVIYNLAFLPAITGAEIRTTVLLLVMVSPIVLMRDHLRFDLRTSLPLLILFAVLWATWMLYGFPQFYTSGYRFPQILSTSDPYHLSLLLNYSTKAVFAAFFASLVEPVKMLRSMTRRRRETSGPEVRVP